LPPNESRLVTGPPGSGKTQALVHRVVYLIRHHNISPETLRLFVPNDVMETMLKSEMKKLGLPETIVTLFDQWCRSFFLHHVSKDLPRIYVNGRIDFEKTRFRVLGILKRKTDLQRSIPLALVDCGEDLPPEAFEILNLAAKNIVLVRNNHQRIHEKAASSSFVVDTLNLHKQSLFLGGDFRTSNSIAQLASLFIEDGRFRDEYLSHVRDEQRMFPASLFYVAPSEEEEMDSLSRYVQLRQASEERIGILLPTINLVHRLAKELKDRGVALEKAIPNDAQNVIHTPYDFENNRPKITTYGLAKGLSFDSVLMPSLTEKALSRIPPHQRPRLFFVGMVRASKWIYLSAVQGVECKEILALKSTKAGQYLTLLH
jgi:DNA helicase IV